MAEILVQAEPREAGSSNEARRLRRDRKLPAVVYGGKKDSSTITLDPREIVSILKSESGQNTIFQLQVGSGSPETVMIFDLQIDPISRSLQHADLVRIAMDVEIEVSIPLAIVGEAVGVVVDGGVMDYSLREIVVSCLPGNIPDEIQVDVSDLEMNSSLRVEDIQLPPDVTLVTEPDRSVLSIVPPVSEADLEADLGLEEEEIEGEVPEEGAEEAPAEGEAPAAEAEEKDESSE